MIAVFTRELKSYMNNMTGHVFIAFLLLFFGVCVGLQPVFGMASFRFAVDNRNCLSCDSSYYHHALAGKDRASLTDNHLFSLPLKVSGDNHRQISGDRAGAHIPTGV